VDDLRWLKAQLNTEWVKYTILLLASPIWWPFVKALWRALNDALRDEGGVFGHAPTAAEMQSLEREYGAHVSPLINVTWEEHESGADVRRAQAPTQRRERPARPAPKSRGFRPSR
jgi:hypothetical protein